MVARGRRGGPTTAEPRAPGASRGRTGTRWLPAGVAEHAKEGVACSDWAVLAGDCYTLAAQPWLQPRGRPAGAPSPLAASAQGPGRAPGVRRCGAGRRGAGRRGAARSGRRSQPGSQPSHHRAGKKPLRWRAAASRMAHNQDRPEPAGRRPSTAPCRHGHDSRGRGARWGKDQRVLWPTWRGK